MKAIVWPTRKNKLGEATTDVSVRPDATGVGATTIVAVPVLLAVLGSLPAPVAAVTVDDPAVVGVPAKGALSYLGELIKAVVVTKPGVKLTEADIKRHCASILPSYKVPHIVEFREQLPRNPAGKVIKHKLI